MIWININGDREGSGKTEISKVIHQALLAAGYKVEHFDDVQPRHNRNDPSKRLTRKDRPHIDKENNDGRLASISVRAN